MNRKAEITAQIAAHRATLNFVAGQLAELEAELLQIEADAPRPVILREIQPEAPKVERTVARKAARPAPKKNPRAEVAETRAEVSAMRAEFTRLAEAQGGRSGARNGAPVKAHLLTGGLTLTRTGHALPNNSDLRFYFDDLTAAETVKTQMEKFLAGFDRKTVASATVFAHEL